MHDPNRSSTLSVRRPAACPSTDLPRSGSASSPNSVSPEKSGPAPAQPPTSAAAPVGAEHVLRSDALLQGRSHVSIVHNGETYQLRATRLGKLILTK